MKGFLRDLYFQYEKASRLDAESYCKVLAQIWNNLRQQSADEAIGIHLGAAFTPKDHPQAALLLSSATIRQTLERSVQFHNLHARQLEYGLDSIGETVVLSIRRNGSAAIARQDIEFRLSTYAAMVRWFAEGRTGANRVRLRSARPSYEPELTRVFQCPIEFAQDEDSISFTAEALNAPIWNSHSIAERTWRLYLEATPSPDLPQTVTARVAAAIRNNLSRRAAGIKTVAPALGVSPRTLQRWLAAESSNYWDILEHERVNRCLELLQLTGTPVSQLASLLGYGNASAFRKAFCRWFGGNAGQASNPNGESSSEIAAAPASFSTGTPLRRDSPSSGPESSSVFALRKRMMAAATGSAACPFATPACPPSCFVHPAWAQGAAN